MPQSEQELEDRIRILLGGDFDGMDLVVNVWEPLWEKEDDVLDT